MDGGFFANRAAGSGAVRASYLAGLSGFRCGGEGETLVEGVAARTRRQVGWETICGDTLGRSSWICQGIWAGVGVAGLLLGRVRRCDR